MKGVVMGADGDRMLAEVVYPFVEREYRDGSIGRYFYIRYGELGPHLRVRFHGDLARLRGEVAPRFERHVMDRLPEGLAGSPAPEPAAVDLPNTHPSVRWIPYEPESARYGGPDGVRVAERLFHVSSAVCAELLRAPQDRESRLGVSLSAAVVGLRAFCDRADEAIERARQHRDHFLAATAWDQPAAPVLASFDRAYAAQGPALCPLVQALWEAAGSGDSTDLPPALGRYHEALLQARDALTRLSREGRLTYEEVPVRRPSAIAEAFLWSYSHMTHNRLGVAPLDECYVMHIAARALGSPWPDAG
jgi:thiopeptide-type bacteriocin biosynthesis protein